MEKIITRGRRRRKKPVLSVYRVYGWDNNNIMNNKKVTILLLLSYFKSVYRMEISVLVLGCRREIKNIKRKNPAQGVKVNNFFCRISK